MKDNNIRGRAFKSIRTVQRKEKPIADNIRNPVMTMFETARILLLTFDPSLEDREQSRVLNLTSGNESAMLPLLKHLEEIDIDRRNLLRSEWELKVRSLSLENGGRTLNIEQEDSTNRVRLNSRVVISTPTRQLQCDVKKNPKRVFCTVDLKTS